MNPNDILAQQQAILNQAAQNAQHWVWGMLAIYAVFLLIGAWVIYMFYARLRDIADELRNSASPTRWLMTAKPKLSGPRLPLPVTIPVTPPNPEIRVIRG